MEQRRKIIVQTGTEGEESLSTPHFVDTEATLLARPVVPLTEPVGPPPTGAYAAAAHGLPAYASSVAPWKRSTLILVVLAAVSVGIASGLAIGLYQSSRAAAPVATQPPLDEPQQATTQPQPELPEPVRVTKPEPEAQISTVSSSDEEAVEKNEEVTARNNSSRPDEKDNTKSESRNIPKRDEVRATPPAMGERVSVRDEEPVTREEKREARREERRERRREERRRQRAEYNDGPLNVPRNVERARQEINRIRDIFEGRQP